MYKSLVSLGRHIPKYSILSVAMVRTLALKGKKTVGEDWKMHGMHVSHLPSRHCANTPAVTTASSLTALNTAQQLAPMIICVILIYGLDLLYFNG